MCKRVCVKFSGIGSHRYRTVHRRPHESCMPLWACLFKSLHTLSPCLNHPIKSQALFWILSGYFQANYSDFLDHFLPFGWLDICKFLCFCTSCKDAALCLYAGYLLECRTSETHLVACPQDLFTSGTLQHVLACTAIHFSCTNIDHQPLIQEYELIQLLKSLLFRSVGSPTCIFHGPKEFTKTVQVLGLIQLKQWFYKITPCSRRISYQT